MAKACKTGLDESLRKYMRAQLLTILTNDQICFREDPTSDNEYKSKLSEKQRETFEPIRQFLANEFDVRLKVWHNIAVEEQDTSVDNIVPIIEGLDPWALNSVF